jgi:hypothetical protein
LPRALEFYAPITSCDVIIHNFYSPRELVRDCLHDEISARAEISSRLLSYGKE